MYKNLKADVKSDEDIYTKVEQMYSIIADLTNSQQNEVLYVLRQKTVSLQQKNLEIDKKAWLDFIRNCRDRHLSHKV